MRIIRLILLLLILTVIVVLSLANRDPVTLYLLPAGLSSLTQATLQVPLFVFGLGAVLLGVVLGYLLEWLREHKHRRRANVKSREAAELGREMDVLRKSSGKAEDDVLALLGN
ncbi:MAG: lipopolysaccharide assembly protein LapA domain-containing protein [Amaricoccus sp.]